MVLREGPHYLFQFSGRKTTGKGGVGPGTWPRGHAEYRLSKWLGLTPFLLCPLSLSALVAVERGSPNSSLSHEPLHCHRWQRDRLPLSISGSSGHVCHSLSSLLPSPRETVLARMTLYSVLFPSESVGDEVTHIPCSRCSVGTPLAPSPGFALFCHYQINQLKMAFFIVTSFCLKTPSV